MQTASCGGQYLIVVVKSLIGGNSGTSKVVCITNGSTIVLKYTLLSSGGLFSVDVSDVDVDVPLTIL